MVFQLPVVPFPESPPVNAMGSYDHARGYVFGTGKLKWSFGGVRGREADWQPAWVTQPVPRLVDGLAAAGFAALYVDDNGFVDHGATINAELVKELGPPVQTSDNARMHWYDLQPRRAALQARLGSDVVDRVGAAVVTMPTVEFVESISVEEQGPFGPFHWMGGEGSIDVTNLADPRDMVLRLSVVGPGGHLTVEGPAGESTVAVPSAQGAPVELRMRIPKGVSHIRLSTDVPPTPTPLDSRDLRVRLVAPTVLPTDIVDALGS
jgi:phosphoglycerol transferase